MEIKRGQIYYADLSPVVGSEQGGFRPVLVIQNDIGNHYSPTIIIAPITTKGSIKANVPTHKELNDTCGLPKKSIVLLEQIRTIDKSRLKNYVGQISIHCQNQVNLGIEISLGL